MKKSSALALMTFAMALSAEQDDLFAITERGPSSKNLPIPPPKPLIPFKEQSGIVNLIDEYKLIQKGESKKGKRKQSRTIHKINEMLEKGYLTKEDIIKL